MTGTGVAGAPRDGYETAGGARGEVFWGAALSPHLAHLLVEDIAEVGDVLEDGHVAGDAAAGGKTWREVVVGGSGVPTRFPRGLGVLSTQPLSTHPLGSLGRWDMTNKPPW